MVEISALVDELVERHKGLLISILEDIQEYYNYLPEEAMKEVSKKLKIPIKDIYGVATFYSAFRLKPKGKNHFTVCLGTACHVRGGVHILDTLERELKIKTGETTEDLEFSIDTANCLGCCAIGPIVVSNGEYHGEMTPKKTLSLLKKCKCKEDDNDA